MSADSDERKRDLAALFRKVESEAYWEHIGAIAVDLARVEAATARALAGSRGGFDARGYVVLPEVIGREEASAFVSVMGRLRDEGVTPLFVYALDAPWAVGQRIAAAVSEHFGTGYDLLDDGWAFWVGPGPNHSGWSPHRGTYDRSIDPRAPDTLNGWLALTDVTLDDSCMWILPRAADPGYPDALAATPANLEGAEALPVAAGTLLLWDANALHWGGASSERARGPRVSITFTLARGDRGGAGAPAPTATLRARLDAVARQILTYGEKDATLSDATVAWANLTARLPDAVRGKR